MTMIGLLCGQILLIYVAWLFLFPLNDSKIFQPLPVNPKVVVAGERINLTLHYIKYANFKAYTAREIRCGINVFVLTPTESDFPIGENTVNIILDVPQRIPTGSECRVHYSITAQFNFIHSHNIQIESEPFTVE